MGTTTSETVSVNHFDRLPDELLEKIFFSLSTLPSRTANNHVRLLEHNAYYYDYSMQQPLLKQNHIELRRALLVCRRFYGIIKSPQFWERKCRQDHLLLPNEHLPTDFTDYEKIYVNNPFHPSFNLLEENNWRKSRNARMQIEPVPIGSYRLYDEFNRLSPCRATSHMEATLTHRDVQLPCKGPGAKDFSRLNPVIEFSIYVVARWDCGAQCTLSLQFSDGHRWQCRRTFPQWNDKKWHRLSYRYAQYQQFPSSVTVTLTGRDTQTWAGFYGIKFAQMRLRMLLRTSENEINEESEVIIEPKEEDELIEEPNANPLPDNTPVEENISSRSDFD